MRFKKTNIGSNTLETSCVLEQNPKYRLKPRKRGVGEGLRPDMTERLTPMFEIFI